MIPSKARESRRVRANKLSKNLERLYKERKCRDCAVVVTRMDFAKILGKFTKVKIQYESSKAPKTKQNANQTSPNSRLKTNENGMVLVHRKAYNQHPAKDPAAPKKFKGNPPTPRVASNILKENNRLKKTASKDTNSNYGKKLVDHNSNLKLYSIVFEDPVKNNNNDVSCKISLADLLPHINESILPSDDWCIDYFPKSDEPKDDKVYDRIAAELEDLMYNEKPVVKPDEKEDNKVDDFPSIMDILNDNTTTESKPNIPSSSPQSNTNLESSDVEAMLLGKTNPSNDTPMEVDNSDIGNIIGDQLGDLCGVQDDSKLPTATNNEPDIDNPHSPSILDETLQKGIEEHLPVPKCLEEKDENKTDVEMPPEQPPSTCEETNQPTITEVEKEPKEIVKNVEDITNKTNDSDQSNTNISTKASVTHVVFKKLKDGSCYKSVTCPKNLKYGIEFAGKSVEFLGAPKFITTLEDLEVLLQIVHESQLDSLYVLH